MLPSRSAAHGGACYPLLIALARVANATQEGRYAKTMETLNIYVKDCSNCPGGMELQFFELLSPVWSGERVRLPFGEGEQRRAYTVIGWSDLFFGSRSAAHRHLFHHKG